MTTLGSRIRQVRGQRSQAEFGIILGVSRSTVASWENNTNQPSIELLITIANLGDVSMDWLTGCNNHLPHVIEAMLHDVNWQEFLTLAHEKRLNPKRLTRIIKDSFLLTAPD